VLGVLIQLPQHLLPRWLLCVKSLAVGLHCFFLEQASEGIFNAAELTEVMGSGGEKARRDRRDLGELGSGWQGRVAALPGLSFSLSPARHSFCRAGEGLMCGEGLVFGERGK